MQTFYQQEKYDLRLGWGLQDTLILAPHVDAIILVDIMSFSSAVSVACDQGAWVYPYRWKDQGSGEYAKKLGAAVAGPRQTQTPSLSPLSLKNLLPGQKLVLPSPNGATLSLATGSTPTFAGCLRNALAVAQAAQTCGQKIAVIACGERWEDQSLRPAFEDLLGAGAILSYLSGRPSPEAWAAQSVFAASQDQILTHLQGCISGQELISREFGDDLPLIAELNTSARSPRLHSAGYYH